MGTLNMQISNLGWSPSGPISRKRLCLVVKCRRSFSNVLWWNVAPFKLKFDIRSQYWFFCLDVYVFIEIKSYVSSYHCYRYNHYVNQFSNQRTNIKSPKEPKTHSLFVHNAISVFLWGFFLSFFMFSTYVSVCVWLCVCVCFRTFSLMMKPSSITTLHAMPNEYISLKGVKLKLSFFCLHVQLQFAESW